MTAVLRTMWVVNQPITGQKNAHGSRPRSVKSGLFCSQQHVVPINSRCVGWPRLPQPSPPTPLSPPSSADTALFRSDDDTNIRLDRQLLVYSSNYMLHCRRLVDCETFRIPHLMSKRTIRIQDEWG